MLSKVYYRGTGSYVERKNVSKSWCIMTEGVKSMLVRFINFVILSGDLWELKLESFMWDF